MPIASSLDPLGVQGKTVKDSDVVCLKNCFDTHQVEGKITLEQFDSIVKSAGTRYLEREISEYIEEFAPDVLSGKAKYVDWFFTKSLVQKESILRTQWKKAADTDKNLRHDITTNVFEQIVASIMLLADTNGEGGQIDTSMFEYVLGSCGEELEAEVFEDVMKIMQHSSKGKFDVKKLLRTYGELGKKVGRFTDEDLDQMDLVIGTVQTRIKEKKAKLELQAGVAAGVGLGDGDDELKDSPRPTSEE